MWKFLCFFIIAIQAAIYFWPSYTPEEKAQRAAERIEREAAREAEENARVQKIRDDYAAKNLPEGCTIRALPKYGDVDHMVLIQLVLIQCEAARTTSTNLQWEESRSSLCGKVPCTQYDTRNATSVVIEPIAEERAEP